MGAVDEAIAEAAAHAAGGRRLEALDGYARVLAEQPGNVVALVNRAVLLNELLRMDEALASCDAALAVKPNLAEAHNNRARALLQLYRHQEALAAAERALVLRPDYVRGWINRGDALRGLQQSEAAIACFRTALRFEPNAFPAHASLGATLRDLGRYAESIAAFDAAEALEGATSTAAHQRALVRLLTGDFAGGWRDAVARWASPEFNAVAAGFVDPAIRAMLTHAPSPADLAGKRVLLISEQGIGDQLMFLSMLPDLLAIAGEVACVCERRLVRLLSAAFPQVRFFDSRDGLPAGIGRFDLAVASGDLGAGFRNSVADFPGTPYVRPRPEVVEAWRARLGPRRAKLRIGVSWRGGSLATSGAARSIPLVQLRRLLELPACEVVSLQYGEPGPEVAAAEAEAGVPIRLFPRAEIDDFEDLAGLIANLDLVVSVQTAVVHLCGALGQTCFTLVPVRPEWRYMTRGETIPWYRSVRIFRQDASEAWAPVIDQVVKAVAAHAAEAP